MNPLRLIVTLIAWGMWGAAWLLVELSDRWPLRIRGQHED